jgi:hypothetical protein
MIVVEDNTELLLVTQPDHARFAAQLLSLWRRRELREHPRRDLLLTAVREHDNGWREADAAPRIDPSSGRPYDFRSLPDEPRRELWRQGVERFATELPYVALLATEHARELHRGRLTEPGWTPFLAKLDERRDELLAAAALDVAELVGDYRWLELADTLSLAACLRSAVPIVRPGLRARWQDGALEIEPFPLAGATTFEIPCRRIPDRRYGGEAELASALGAARWVRLAVRCCRAGRD